MTRFVLALSFFVVTLAGVSVSRNGTGLSGPADPYYRAVSAGWNFRHPGAFAGRKARRLSRPAGASWRTSPVRTATSAPISSRKSPPDGYTLLLADIGALRDQPERLSDVAVRSGA